MKTIEIKLQYSTEWGQELFILGSVPELGNWNKENFIPLSYVDKNTWSINTQVPIKLEQIAFKFFLFQDDIIKKSEYGNAHSISLSETQNEIICLWQEKPKQAYFNTSMFSNSIFKHQYCTFPYTTDAKVQFTVNNVHIETSQELVIAGNIDQLGKWDETRAIPLLPIEYGKWKIEFDLTLFEKQVEYKFAIRNKETKRATEWEEGANRVFQTACTKNIVVEQEYKKPWLNWKASGIAIPIFSLRSENSFGIGEFSDLKLVIDWAVKTKMRVVQLLPINDTTATYSWLDSYPYNAISIYALHPIYLGLHKFSLKDENKNNNYITHAKELNELATLDYSKVIQLKSNYLQDLYFEISSDTLASQAYIDFYAKNKIWLFPYASFCFLRDKYNTTCIKDWGEFSTYNKLKLEQLFSDDTKAQQAYNLTCFTQFLLHAQLTEMKEYAHENGVVLKGDIPIGISPNSVEAWTEPHLFNLNTQTGAPPDDFSTNGQNWGFPTYNWDEMKKDSLKWWTNRFVKMTDYFDVYRIDHILGFFRIWEIPIDSIFGLLGHFSPAIPLSIDEINDWGIDFYQEFLIGSIHEHDLYSLFGEHIDEIKQNFLNKEEVYYTLKEEFDTQRKISVYFGDSTDERSSIIKEGLYSICNEVIFIKDKTDPDKLHPRIQLNKTFKYERLTDNIKEQLIKLHDHFFHTRHTDFWKSEALSKLPTLINSTAMLVCGEDLGMVPLSVPDVMHQLEIFSLEIQRMPKKSGVKFGNLGKLPYLSVCTTSTHDMSPIRIWWEESKEDTQEYYKTVLHKEGEAPKTCDAGICLEIIKKHLESPAMLAILPLQDWLSISDTLRRKNPEEERINIPANSKHNWNYRMHITLEELTGNEDFSDKVNNLNQASGR